VKKPVIVQYGIRDAFYLYFDLPLRNKSKSGLKQFLLTEKQHDYGVVALLNKEFDLAVLNLQLTELDAFIAALEARKAAIA